MLGNLSKLAGISAVIASLTAAPLMAQDVGEWDTDEDTMLTEEEFGEGFGERGVFGEWDEDQDEMLTEDEFNRGVFGQYDRDETGAIEEPEFGDVGDDMGDEGFWDM